MCAYPASVRCSASTVFFLSKTSMVSNLSANKNSIMVQPLKVGRSIQDAASSSWSFMQMERNSQLSKILIIMNNSGIKFVLN